MAMAAATATLTAMTPADMAAWLIGGMFTGCKKDGVEEDERGGRSIGEEKWGCFWCK
jgi:hypothetical protein